MSAPWENAAGLVESKVRRATGSRVSVYRTREAGIDPTCGDYAAVCEDHGSLIVFPKSSQARHHAVRPDGWCEGCSEETDR